MITKEKSTTELRREAKRAVDALSSERLQTAADFLGYLQKVESEDATEELMRIPGALQAHKRGKKQIAEGKTANWREVRSDV